MDELLPVPERVRSGWSRLLESDDGVQEMLEAFGDLRHGTLELRPPLAELERHLCLPLGKLGAGVADLMVVRAGVGSTPGLTGPRR